MVFFICDKNKLVNHLDKIAILTNGEMPRGVIVRAQIGCNQPLKSGCQHSQDHTEALRLLMRNTMIVKLEDADTIQTWYRVALQNALAGMSTVLVEIGERYV